MSLNSIKDENLIKTGQTILLNKPKDLYFIGDDNFIAITKYNRSHFYAKAVYDLSLEFKWNFYEENILFNPAHFF